MMDELAPYTITNGKLSEKAKQANYDRHKETWLSA
jgi:hypothetical protein